MSDSSNSINQCETPNSQEPQQYPPSVQAFMRSYDEYRSILNESSKNYLDHKNQITQIYQSRFSEIDNYMNMRSELINQESKFRHQIITDGYDDA